MTAMLAESFLDPWSTAAIDRSIAIVHAIYTKSKLIVHMYAAVRRLNRVTVNEMVTPHTRLQQDMPRLICCWKTELVRPIIERMSLR